MKLQSLSKTLLQLATLRRLAVITTSIRAIYLILPCFEGNIGYIALEPGPGRVAFSQPLINLLIDQSIDLPFDLQGTVKKTSFLI